MEANIIRIFVVLIGIALVAVIMLQQPKEGGMGAFTGGGGGSGASSTVFGAKGSGAFLFRLTAGLVLAFAIGIVALVKVTNSSRSSSVLSSTADKTELSIPSTENTPAGEKVNAPADKPSDNDNAAAPENQPASADNQTASSAPVLSKETADIPAEQSK